MNPLLRMGLIILGLLALASLVSSLLRRLFPRKDFSELQARIRAWWVMVAIFFGALLGGRRLFLLLFALLSYWGLREYFALLREQKHRRRLLVLSLLAIPLQYYWILTDWYGMFVVFIPVYMFLILPVAMVLAQDTRHFVMSVAEVQWGLMVLVFGMSHLGYLAQLPIAGAPPSVDGRTLLVFLVFLVEMSDVSQYVWGKLLGKRKILARVSPNKTWEGLLGGMLSTLALASWVRFLTPFSVGETVFLAVSITVTGFFGGAVMSSVKRDSGVKDFGTLIPGHGGVLDRIDSLCYAGPLFFHYARYFHG